MHTNQLSESAKKGGEWGTKSNRTTGRGERNHLAPDPQNSLQALCLPGRGKPEVLRPDICRDARVYGLTDYSRSVWY